LSLLFVCHVTGCSQSGHDESSAWSNASRDYCSSAGIDAVPNGISSCLCWEKSFYSLKLDFRLCTLGCGS